MLIYGTAIAAAAPDPWASRPKPAPVTSDLRGPDPDVGATGPVLALPAVPAFELPVAPAGTHSPRELAVVGKPLLGTEITVTGYVLWIYDCATALRKPGMSRAKAQKLIDDDPTLCERKKLYLGDARDTPLERGLWVVDVPRPPNKLERERLPRQELAAWPKVPRLAVGQYVAITGTFALSSPHSERNSDGLVVWKSFRAATPAPLKVRAITARASTLPELSVPKPAARPPASELARKASVNKANEATRAYGQKQYQLALDSYRDAIKAWDGNHVAWYGMAGAAIGQSNWTAAADAMKHAFDLAPTQPMYAMVYGYTLYESAVSTAREDQARREGRPPDQIVVDLTAINFDHAEQLLRHATKLNGDLWRAHYYLGRIARDSGRPTVAATELSASLAHGPSLPGPYVALAELYRQWQRPDLALAVAELGTQHVTRPEDASDLWYEVGMSHDDQRHDTKAIEGFTRAIDARADNVKARFQRGQAYARAGKRRQAKADLEAFVRAAPPSMEFAKQQASKLLMDLAARN